MAYTLNQAVYNNGRPMFPNIKNIFASFLIVYLLSNIFIPKVLIAADRTYLDISTQETRKINIAVPWFKNSKLGNQKQVLGRDLSTTLAKALAFHGIISIIPQQHYGGNHNIDWGKFGTDYVVLGSYEIKSKKIFLKIRLLDVAGDEVVLGKTYSGSLQQKDSMTFTFTDSVIETLTGRPGISSSRIAFVNRTKNVKEVYMTDILGRKIRQITRHKHLTVSPRFVPGGHYLSYTSYHTGNQNLYITDLRQSKTTRVLSRRKGLNLAPSWSSDGKKMVLTLSKSGNPDLYLLDNKGQILEQLTSRSGINVSPTLSPDGKHLVFVSDRSGNPQLYYMNMVSRKVKRLTFEGSENAEPNWSPTENLIVYSSLRNGVYQIFTMNPLSNNSPKQVTQDLSHHESPTWSPDGNQIIFTKRHGKKSQIYGVMRNGSFQRNLFTIPGSQIFPQWAR